MRLGIRLAETDHLVVNGKGFKRPTQVVQGVRLRRIGVGKQTQPRMIVGKGID